MIIEKLLGWRDHESPITESIGTCMTKIPVKELI
jgi:hypothetical protein